MLALPPGVKLTSKRVVTVAENVKVLNGKCGDEHSLKECDDDVQLKVFHAVMDYGLYNKHTQLSGIAKSLFLIMKPLIDSNVQNYNNAKKGGKKPK